MSDPARLFLARVLPWQQDAGDPVWFNIHYTVSRGTKVQWRSRAEKSLDALVKTLAWVQKQPDSLDLYICMSSQRIATAKEVGNGHIIHFGERSKNGAVGHKTLRIDVDVKADAYTDTATAGAALAKFLVDANLPRPTLIVGTGSGGFHAHWVLDRVLNTAEWQPLADALKRACEHFGLMTDTACTTDPARILRIPGTKNHKHTPPRDVVLGALVQPSDIPVEMMEARLAPFIQAVPQLGPTPGVGGSVHQFSNPLEQGLPQRSFSLTDFISAAGYLVNHDTKPWGTYEVWREFVFACVWIEATMPIYAADVRKLFETIVALAGRSPEDNAERYATALQSTAEKLARGEQVQTASSIFKRATDLGWAAPKPPEEELPTTPPSDLPAGYTRAADGTIFVVRVDDKGETQKFQMLPYPMTEAWLSADPPSLNFRTRLGRRAATITVPLERTARKENVAGVLGGQGMVLKTAQHHETKEFIVAWITHLQRTRNLVDAAAFGWTGDGFAYGGAIHTPGGNTPSGTCDPVIAGQYDPCGALEPWLEAAAMITSQKRPELDIILASAFAAPLVRFTGQDGLLVCAHSPESGVGKTTALRVAQAVWGHPIMGAQSLNDTYNHTVNKLGAIRHLPVFWDEIKSEEQAQRFVDLAFQLSSGREKGRLSATSTMRKSGHWETMLLSCSNDSIVESIAGATKTSTAGVHRVFEYRVRPAKGTMLSSQAGAMVKKLESNFGQAGLLYAAYLGGNGPAVQKGVETLIARLETKFQSTPEERFWFSTIASLLMGAKLANHLSLTSIDEGRMLDFMVGQLQFQRSQLGQTSVDMQQSMNVADVLARYVKDMRMRYTLFTDVVWRNPGRPIGVKYTRPMQNLADVRIHIGTQDRYMRLTLGDFKTWLALQKIPAQAIVDGCIQQLHATRNRTTLGAGTELATGQIWVMDFDLNAPAIAPFFDGMV